MFCMGKLPPVEVTLPHTWNTPDTDGSCRFRGTSVYKKHFSLPSLKAEECLFLELNGAAMTAEVFLNGKKLCRHEGGYSTFRVDLTGELMEENNLVITVDNSENETVYPQQADFTFYGGLYRDVNLIMVPRKHFELSKDGTPGIRVTPIVNLRDRTAEVTVETWQNGGSVSFRVNGEEKTVKSSDGYAKAVFSITDVHLWDGVDDPYLYEAAACLDSGDEIRTRFGCRDFRIDPEKGFFLNGRSYPLRGVSRHQDRIIKGNALTAKDHEEDMAVVKELGANTLRLAHYQHAREFYDLCDENGIIVWAEIPYITRHMPSGRRNTLDQMRELITQNYNHPSIVCWGLSNEISAVSPVDEDMLENHRMLNDLCHRMDQTRVTVMAHVYTQKAENPLSSVSDIGSYNLYFGWYQGELEQNGTFLDEYHHKYPDRVIGLSEYGADANTCFHSPDPKRGDYTEEYQCVFHEKLLNDIEARPYLWATHVWNLFDFGADGREEGGKKGQNQKGLVEFDHKTKKDAFYLYKAAWSKVPFVHLCGRRYEYRAEQETTVKVYSNQSKVALYLDDTLLEEKTGNRVFCFSVPLSNRHVLRAVSGDCEDEIVLHYTQTPKAEYQNRERGDVANWFGEEGFKEDYYSIYDSVGDLMNNPATLPIVRPIFVPQDKQGMKQQEEDGLNDAMMEMISGIALKNILKHAGDQIDQETIKLLNAALQKIKK